MSLFLPMMKLKDKFVVKHRIRSHKIYNLINCKWYKIANGSLSIILMLHSISFLPIDGFNDIN